MPRIEWPVVAVSLHSASSVTKTRTVSAVVCTPVSVGGGSCEEYAMEVAKLLAEHEASCEQGACQYDNWGNFFYIQVLATWNEPVPACFSAFIAETALPFAVNCTAQQEIQQEQIGAMGESAPVAIYTAPGRWTVTLVEEFPLGETGTAVGTEPFTLKVVRNGAVEVYTGCRWRSISREDTPTGLRQTRTAVAAGRSVTEHE